MTDNNAAIMPILDAKRFNDRIESDRRAISWRTVLFGLVRSRRREQRRDGDDAAIPTDWQHPWLFFLAVGTMILSALDAFLTLELIDRGAVEVNPVMAGLIEHDVALFAIVKLALTGLGLLMLAFAARFKVFQRLRVGLLITLLFVFYACLICYEFVSLMAVL